MPERTGRAFYFATITLLLAAVIGTFIQKRHESAVAVLMAHHTTEVSQRATGEQVTARETNEFEHEMQEALRRAALWQATSIIAASVALLSFSLAVFRHEAHRRSAVVALLLLFVGLQLMLV